MPLQLIPTSMDDEYDSQLVSQSSHHDAPDQDNRGDKIGKKEEAAQARRPPYPRSNHLHHLATLDRSVQTENQDITNQLPRMADALSPLCQGKMSASLAEDPAECVCSNPSNANLPPEQVSLPSEAESRRYGAAEGRDAEG
jgi:hypothetical protein